MLPKYTIEDMKKGVACLRQPTAIGVICFDVMFWTIGTAFFSLVVFYASHVLRLSAIEQTRFFIRVFTCTGLGLLGGAFGMRKVCHRISPIVTYSPAFIFMAIGLYGIFHSTPIVFQQIGAVTTTINRAPDWVYPLTLILGLGGGMILGRTGVDLQAVVDEKARRGISIVEAVAIATTVLTTTLLIGVVGLSEVQIQAIIDLLPMMLVASLPIAFALSWIIDIDIYTKKDSGELFDRQVIPGATHRAGYRALRALARLGVRWLFKYEPIDAHNVPYSGAVLAANHGSFIDPLLISCGTERIVQYVIYSTYYRSIAHPIFRFLRCIPLDEQDQLGALRTCVKSLKVGGCIGIFPEGRVSEDGSLSTPMRGALFLAQHSGAPVVPVALKGDYQALPRGSWLPHLVKVTPIFGTPFAVDKDLSREDIAELTDHLMVDLAHKLEVEPPARIVSERKE